jgi:3-hydroxyisobutyrate dehydrogenase-like beta-hydroxyacid dehydrogenase
MRQLGFVGLGTMGEPMAGHLLRANGRLNVWNRTGGKADALVANGATESHDLKQLAEMSDCVLLCVNRSEDVREVLDELVSAATPNTLFVDHSTIAPGAAKEIGSDLLAKGFRFVDAPVTGGSMGAQKGQLTIFCGGSEADVAEAIEVCAPYSKRAERVGPSGSGQMAKMTNQIAVGGALLALCESLSFARKAGLDLKQIREMVGSGSGGSWAFDNYGPKILASDWSPGFSVKNQRKDFGYCFEAAAQVNACVAGTKVVDDLLAGLEAEGHAEWATAALYQRMLELGFE